MNLSTNMLTVKKDVVVLPKSVTTTRIATNLSGPLAVLPKLNTADIEKLDGVAAAGKQKRFITPPWGMSHRMLFGAFHINKYL